MANRDFIKKLVNYKWISISFALSLTLVLGGWIWAWLRLGNDQVLTLHFSPYTGINQAGGISYLHAFGFLGLVILVLDWLIAQAFEERDWFLGKLLAFAGLALGVLIFIGFMVIMNVN